MADKANLIHPDGSVRPVKANNLTFNDQNKEYRCCGVNRLNGKVCGCKMTLVICNQQNNYFKELPGEHHISFCNYDQSEDALKVSHLTTHTDKGIDELYQTINKQKDTKKKVGNPHPGAEGSNRQNHENDDNDEDDRPIDITQRDPKNAEELYYLLTRFDKDDEYAGIKVNDILFDARNRNRLNEEGIPEGHPVLVVTHRTNIKDNNELSDLLVGKIVLQYCYHKHEDEPIYFAFDADKSVWSQVTSSKAIGKHFVVFGRWEKSDQYPSLYICTDRINKNAFAMLKSE